MEISKLEPKSDQSSSVLNCSEMSPPLFSSSLTSKEASVHCVVTIRWFRSPVCIFQGLYQLNDRFSLLNCLLCLLLAEWVHSGLVFWVFLVMGFYGNDVQRTESSVLSFAVGYVFVGCSWFHYSSLHEFIFHVSH